MIAQRSNNYTGEVKSEISFDVAKSRGWGLEFPNSF